VSSSRASLPQRPRSLNDCRAISVRRDTLLSPSGARSGRRAAYWQGRWGHHRLCGVAGATRTRDVLFRSGPAGRLVGREASAAAAWAKSRWATLQTLVPTSADTAIAARFGSIDDRGAVHQVTLRQRPHATIPQRWDLVHCPLRRWYANPLLAALCHLRRTACERLARACR